jgi:hypothetical protein
VKTVNNDSGRLIVSCDYCDLHWHFDCLDPPLMALPSSAKKWMCPAHAEHVVVSSAAWLLQFMAELTLCSLDLASLDSITLP